MTNKNIYMSLGGLDPELIMKAAPAEKVQKKKKNGWMKWASLAACLCLVVVGALTIPFLQNESPHGDIIIPLSTLPQAETMSVELVEWYWNGFRGIVVDASDNSIFSAGDELEVHFDDSTEILLDDGTVMVFNTKESDTNAIGWKDGSIVTVKFATYDEDRTFAIASYVEVKE